MGKRRVPRIPEHTSARIFGLDKAGKPFSQAVETLDISYNGARLANISQFDQPGETIGMEVEGRKGRFVVAWVGRPGSKTAGQVGLRSVDPQKSIWKQTLKSGAPDSYHPPRSYSSSGSSGLLSYLEWRDERRLTARRKLRASVRIISPLRNYSGWGVCTDIHAAGCYIETADPLPVEARVELLVRLRDREMTVRGIVRSCRRFWGMGVQFTELSAADREYLQQPPGQPARPGAQVAHDPHPVR